MRDPRLYITVGFYALMLGIAALHPFHDPYGLKNRLAILCVGALWVMSVVVYNRIALGAFFPGRREPDISSRNDVGRLAFKFVLVTLFVIAAAVAAFVISRA